MIPKAFHFVWIGPKPPWWAKENMRRFQKLNPEFSFRLHGEEVLLKAFEHAYQRVEGEHLLARRSDLLRVSALLRYGGGWYFDCDFLPIRPLAELYCDYEDFPRGCFVTHCDHLQGRPWMANGIIGTTADSPFFAIMVAGLIYRGDCSKTIVWESYGPGLVTPLVEQHRRLVHVGDIDMFYPCRVRAKAMATYKRIAEADYSHEAVIRELGEPLPYMMHQSMQDALEL